MMVTIFSLSIVFLVALANVAYFIAHSNGKKNIRLYTALILSAYLVHSFVFDLPEYGIWIGMISLVSLFDIIIDWKNTRIHA